MTHPLRRLSTMGRLAAVMAAQLAFAAADDRHALAVDQLVAITGDAQPGGGGAKLQSVAAASVNDAGQVALRATLAHGLGGVTAANDSAIWRIGGAIRELMAQTGVSGAPNVGANAFGAFTAHALANDGTVAVRAALNVGNQGLWRLEAPASASVLALTGSLPAPLLPTAQLDSVGFTVLQSPAGVVAFDGRLDAGIGGVSTANDRAVWVDAPGSVALVAREGVSPVPDVAGAKFAVVASAGVNDVGQALIVGTLEAGPGGVTPLDANGLWRLNSSGGELVLRRTASDAPGVAGAHFDEFHEPAMNAAGQVALHGVLFTNVAVNATNNQGVWLYDGPAGQLIARSGTGEAPGVPGGTFADFGGLLLNDAGQVLFAGSLAPSVGSVTSANNRGLWIADSANGSLIARTGVGVVPDMPLASFADFGAMAFNEQGVAAVDAALAPGAGGVSTGNDRGLWLLDASGGGVLVARTGAAWAGRTIAAVEFQGGSAGGDGRSRALNRHGQLAYKATFTSGEEAVFLYTPELSWRGAATGDWDEAASWTLGLDPAAVHRVTIAPPTPTLVAGPEGETTVKSLAIGGGAAAATLELVVSSQLRVTEGVQIAANGRLAGQGALHASVASQGAVSPGSTLGELTIDGAFLQTAAGRLEIELGGVSNDIPNQPQFDRLIVVGQASVSGRIAVSLANGFIPAVGDSFGVLSAAGGLTAVGAVDLPALPAGRIWQVLQGPKALTLQVAAGLAGDFDGDGSVGGADLLQWKSGFGATAPGSATSGDADGDGDVDGADFLIWQRHARPPALAQVPEPAAAAFVIAAAAAAVLLRRGPIAASGWSR